MTILIHCPYIKPHNIRFAGYTITDKVEAALAWIDVTCFHSTENPDPLECSVPGASIVNIARGGIIDENVLWKCAGA